eukprot:scaffold16457_cov109-Isochrysis_galbana.AAC.3
MSACVREIERQQPRAVGLPSHRVTHYTRKSTHTHCQWRSAQWPLRTASVATPRMRMRAHNTQIINLHTRHRVLKVYFPARNKCSPGPAAASVAVAGGGKAALLPRSPPVSSICASIPTARRQPHVAAAAALHKHISAQQHTPAVA